MMTDCCSVRQLTTSIHFGQLQ